MRRLEFYVHKDGAFSDGNRELLNSGFVHFSEVHGDGSGTLCGYKDEGEPIGDQYALMGLREVTKKVTCPYCIAIVIAIKSIKNSEMEK